MRPLLSKQVVVTALASDEGSYAALQNASSAAQQAASSVTSSQLAEALESTGVEGIVVCKSKRGRQCVSFWRANPCSVDSEVRQALLWFLGVSRLWSSPC